MSQHLAATSEHRTTAEEEDTMSELGAQSSPQAALNLERTRTIRRFFDALGRGATEVLEEILMPGAVTHWPQTGERITGATSCIRVHASYPGWPPHHEIVRISGGGDAWTAELVADYGAEGWHIVSLIEFDGARIGRLTDYFGPTLPAPEWRRELVDRDTAPVQGAPDDAS
jgi:hypothetical protein